MIRPIGHFLAALLSAGLAFIVIAWTLGGTLGSPEYIDNQAEQAELYDKLAAVVPGGNPEVIQTQMQSLLPQLNAYLVKGGPAPVTDFGAGPVTLGVADQPLPAFTRLIVPAAQIVPIIVLILAALIVVLGRSHSFGMLSRASFGAAVSVAIGAGLIWVSAVLLNQSLSRPDFAGARDALSPFVSAVFNDVALRLLIAAAILAAAGGLLLVAQSVSHVLARFIHLPERKSKAGQATPFPPA